MHRDVSWAQGSSGEGRRETGSGRPEERQRPYQVGRSPEHVYIKEDEPYDKGVETRVD